MLVNGSVIPMVVALPVKMIVAIIKYDVIVCNICTHAQQRFLTVTRAKWWSLYAGRNPETSLLYSSHGYSATQTRLPWMM